MLNYQRVLHELPHGCVHDRSLVSRLPQFRPKCQDCCLVQFVLQHSATSLIHKIWFQAIPSESGNWSVPSGKRLHNYGKIQHFQMGKLPEGMI